MPRTGMGGRRRQMVAVVVTFVAALLLVLHNPLDWAADEHLYINGGLAMYEGASKLVPQYYHGGPRFQKPPLMYWLVAASYSLLGVSLFAGRLPALLLALAVLYFVFRLASEDGQRPARGHVAVIILCAHYLFLYFSRSAVTDMAVTAGLTGAAFFLFRFMRSAGPAGSLYLAALCAGLGAMAKGPIALVLLAAGLLGYGFLDRSRAPWKAFPPGRAAGPLLLLTVLAVWWYVAMGATFGDAFWRHQLQSEVAVRTGGVLVTRLRNLLWYPYKLAVSVLPFTLLVASLRIGAVRRPPSSSVNRIALGFLAAPILVYGLLIDYRASRYMLPAAPFLAVYLAAALDPWLSAGDRDRPAASRILVVVTGAILVLFTAFAGLLLAMARNGTGPRQTAWLVAALFAGTVLMAALLRGRRDRRRLTVVTAMAMILVFSLSSIVFKGTLRDYAVLKAAAASHRLGGTKIYLDRELGSRDIALMVFFGDRDALVYEKGMPADLELVKGPVEPRRGRTATAEFRGLGSRWSGTLTPGSLRQMLKRGDLLNWLPEEKYYFLDLETGAPPPGIHDGDDQGRQPETADPIPGRR